MGKFSFIGKLFSPSKPRAQPPIVLPEAATTPSAAEERRQEASAGAARRLRVSEKRRRGRRASILSDISDEEAQLATVKRPEGRSAKVLFGS